MNCSYSSVGARAVLLPAVMCSLALATRHLSAQDAEPLTGQSTEDIFVHSRDSLMEDGQTIDWAAANNKLLIGKRGVSRYFHVYSVSPEGFMPKCLTLTKDKGSQKQHHGCASWHPSGSHFIFTSQNKGSSSYRMSRPGTGLNCNLWLGNQNGTAFWQLTDVKTSYTSPKGVVYPYFSPDGSRLLWAGNTGEYPRESLWGTKALFLADFELQQGGVPALSNLEVLQPGDQKDFYEAHGFSPDGNRIIFSANLKKDQSVYGMDIYTWDLRKSKLEALTDSPGVWDEFATYSPDGQKIVWMSSAGQNLRFMSGRTSNWQRFLKSELWIMNADGSDPKQLTFYNDPDAPEYFTRRCFVGDSAWSPDGTRVAICLNYETRNFDVDTRVCILQLGLGPPKATEAETPATSLVPQPPSDEESSRPTSRPAIPLRW